MNFCWGDWRAPYTLYSEAMLKVNGRSAYTWILNKDGKFYYYRRVGAGLLTPAEVLDVATPLAAETEADAKEAALALYRLGE